MGSIHRLTNREEATPDIVAVGQTTIDTVFIDRKPPFMHIGGSAYIPAQIMADLGIRVGLVCCLGEELSIAELRNENLDLRGVKSVPGPSTSVELHYSNQNLVGLRVGSGASDRLDISQLPADYFEAKLFYLSPAPICFLLSLTELACAHRIALAFSPKEDFPNLEKPEMKQLLSCCKFCFVNERELSFVTNIESQKDAIAALHRVGAEIVIVTKGKKGVSISTREAGAIDMSPSKVVLTENPIGAGDCFAATLLASWINGCTVVESARRASAYTEHWLTNRKESSYWEAKR